MDIRLASGNRFKIDETKRILVGADINIIPFPINIEELQTLDVEKLVKDKLLKAFKKIGRPLMVEHTGLYIDQLNGFPGGLTQIFWDSLMADKFAEMIGHLRDSRVIAKTVIGYCDGRMIHFFYGEVKGNISKVPQGNRDFQWDCVFIPEGETETFSEMGDRKNTLSMRRKALEEFKRFILKGDDETS